MDGEPNSCNFLSSTVTDMSDLAEPLSYTIRRRLNTMAVGMQKTLVPNPTKKGTEPTAFAEVEPLDLQPGECVQVCSIDEITATLDERNRYKGLVFMPEMKKFCGKNYKVFKRVQIIKLESTGEVRKLRSPTVFLEGVYCNGERHQGCDRACFHFWREAWLKRIPDV